MLIREASYPDTDRIFELYEQTRAAYSQSVIGGWGGDQIRYDSIFGDIDDGICYTVADESGNTVASFVCDFSDDTDYRTPFGCRWYEGEYAVLHRVAVSDGADLVSVLGEIVRFVTTRCKENFVPSIRSGAHPKHEALCTALVECGFESCGRLRTAYGEERTAYRLWVEQP